jgi:antitoxin (DNA-binding transcriptional repressor) of toxin-antitoxin stability system
MPSTTLEDAQAHLAEWISKLQPGEELQITQEDRIIARLTKLPANQSKQPGKEKTGLATDWNNPLMDEYNDYDSHR